MFAWFTKINKMDERSILHRYKATRLSVLVVLLVMLGWILYEQFVNNIFRYDLFLLILIMAVVKLVARFYYSKTN